MRTAEIPPTIPAIARLLRADASVVHVATPARAVAALAVAIKPETKVLRNRRPITFHLDIFSFGVSTEFPRGVR